MKEDNFQNWLTAKVSDRPEEISAQKLEHLRIYLSEAMRELRTKAGLTQAQLAKKLGVKQAAVSKLESALKAHEMESVLHYLHTLEADLLVAVKQGEKLYQVTNNQDDIVLLDVPAEIVQLAKKKGISLREYVQAAIEQFQKQDISDPDATNTENPLHQRDSG